MDDYHALKRDVDRLKKRVQELERRTGVFSAPQKAAPAQVRQPKEPSMVQHFFHWLKEDWLMKLGAFLLILALAWFVRFAFLNDWVGPIGRVSLGLLTGAAIMAFGHFQVEKRRVPGQVLMITGEIMLLVTLYAAQHFYDLFSSTISLGMMVVVVISTALLSILHDSKSMSVTALLGGALAPILASSGSNDYLSLLLYIFILDLGVLAVVSRTGWRFLTLLGLIITGLYSLFFWDLERAFGVEYVWLLMALFFGLFFLANIVTLIRTRKASISDLIIAAFSGLLLLIWVSEHVAEESASLVLSGVTLIMVGASSLLLKRGFQIPLYIYSALGLVFLGAATAFELDGAALVIAFSLEALAAVALASTVLKTPAGTRLVSAVHVLPIVMAVESLDHYAWRNPVVGLFHEHFFVVLVVCLSLAGTAVLLNRLQDAKESPWVFRIITVLSSFFAIAFTWLSLHKLFEDGDIARGIALVIYTLVGVGLLYHGTQIKKGALRLAGGILLGGVVLRLLLVEVWQMPLSGRIVTFVAVGILLVATAFFEKKLH